MHMRISSIYHDGYVNLCFVIVYKLPDALSLHASELFSRILEHSSSPQAQPLEIQSLLASIKTGEESL